MKVATIAVVIRFEGKQPNLIDIVSDDGEIRLLEEAVEKGESDPLNYVYEFRKRQQHEDAEFGDYVEELLSRPFVRPEVQEHGIQWMKSKLKIEQYQKTETQAAKIIAEYALKVLEQDHTKTDFMIAGPSSMVRVKIVNMSEGHRREVA
jgi:hypothetical protein